MRSASITSDTSGSDFHPAPAPLALGAAPLGGVYGETSQADADELVAQAVAQGMTLIDVAPYYGLTRAETVLGRALASIPREAYVLMTKVGRYGDRLWDFSRDAVLRSFEESRARLGVEHIDVLQCHDIEYGDRARILDEALPALRELKAQGLIGAVGVTGYDLNLLEKVAVDQQVDTVMAYCTYTLQDRRLASTARSLARRGITVFNASPLGMGLLTSKGPPDWHPAHAVVKAAAARAARACEAAGADISALAMRFAVQTAAEHGIASTVVGMSTAAHLPRNLEALTAPIDAELLAQVESILEPVRDLGWDKPVLEERRTPA